MITFPVWQELLIFINNLSIYRQSYIEYINKKIIVKGKKGVCPKYLKRCFNILENLNLVTRSNSKHCKPYRLTSKGNEAAQAINTLKRMVKKGADNV